MNVPSSIAAIRSDKTLTTAEKRRILINMSRRRIKPGTGSSHEFLQRRTAMTPWPDLRPILEEIPWVVIGGVATRAYMPERATKDLDILVHLRESDRVIQRLEQAGYVYQAPLTVPGCVMRSPGGVEIDVIWGEFSWLEEALAHPREDPAGYPVLELPYLVLMKAEVARVQDLGDISRMLGLASEEELQQVRSIVQRDAPHLSEDVESLIYLGQLEMKGNKRA